MTLQVYGVVFFPAHNRGLRKQGYALMQQIEVFLTHNHESNMKISTACVGVELTRFGRLFSPYTAYVELYNPCYRLVHNDGQDHRVYNDIVGLSDYGLDNIGRQSSQCINSCVHVIILSIGRSSVIAALHHQRMMQKALGLSHCAKGSGQMAYPTHSSFSISMFHVQNPYVASKRFDGIVRPFHDGVAGGNILRTLGSLSLLQSVVAPHHNNHKHRCGLFVGGPNKRSRLSWRVLKNFLDHFLCYKRACNHNVVMTLVIVTSRRTPPDIYTHLRDYATQNALEFLGFDGDYESTIQSCDSVVVTLDSISMLSDLASTKNTILGLALSAQSSQSTRQQHKFAHFYQALEKRHLLHIVDIHTPYESFKKWFDNCVYAHNNTNSSHYAIDGHILRDGEQGEILQETKRVSSLIAHYVVGKINATSHFCQPS